MHNSTFAKDALLAGCERDEKKIEKTVARFLNPRTIRRPDCNGAADSAVKFSNRGAASKAAA